jgi:cyanophycin synthetase
VTTSSAVLRARVDLIRTVGIRRLARRRVHDRRFRALALDRSREVARSLWADAAHALGAEMRELGGGIYEFQLDDAIARVSAQSTPLADPVSIRVANDKALAVKILSRAGTPTADSIVVDGRDLHEAEEFLASLDAPCVVKPVVGGGGHAVTGHVRTSEQLGAAVRLARTGGSRVLVERMVDGDHFRFLLLDGRLLDVLRRRRPQVKGDGQSNIEQLILSEYRRRLDDDPTVALKPFRFDLDCVYTLADQGLHLGDVLPQGLAATIKTATNFGQSNETETHNGPVAEGLLAEIRTAAAAVGVRLAGVDVIAAGVDVPLADSGGVVLEVNPVPGLMHHYNVARPDDATAVGVPILKALLETGPLSRLQ